VNRAAPCTQMQMTELAVQWVGDTARHGWLCYPLFERDPNLDSLRMHPGFDTVLQEIRAEWDRHRAALQPNVP
jgi:hypothetical protein